MNKFPRKYPEVTKFPFNFSLIAMPVACNPPGGALDSVRLFLFQRGADSTKTSSSRLCGSGFKN